MKITVTTLSDEIFTLDVSEDLELENFKAFCEVESGFPAREILVVFNGRPMVDEKKPLKEFGIKDGDIVTMQHMISSMAPTNQSLRASGDHKDSSMAPTNQSLRASGDHKDERRPSPAQQQAEIPRAGPTIPPPVAPGLTLPTLDFSGIQVPPSTSRSSGQSADDPVIIREMFLANRDQISILQQNNPRLADALLSGSLERFAGVLQEQQEARAERQRQRIRMMNSDVFDMEAQRLIADEIRQKNIEANMEAAMEYNPETFGTVVMLYINCRVNGYPVKAFIDSGAQTTIMSAACAERCHIMRLVDTRWSGYAKGVGVQKIIGRIHMVQLQIEGDYLISSFSVLAEQPMDMLLGLDMLKRHQCTIDLNHNHLLIGTTGTVTRFLAEGELPECARLSGPDEDAVMADSVTEAEDHDLAKALQRSTQETAGPSTASDQASAAGASRVPRADPAVTVMPGDQFTDAVVRELVTLGFTREQVIAELRRFKGDKTQATAALFAKSLKF